MDFLPLIVNPPQQFVPGQATNGSAPDASGPQFQSYFSVAPYPADPFPKLKKSQSGEADASPDGTPSYDGGAIAAFFLFSQFSNLPHLPLPGADPADGSTPSDAPDGLFIDPKSAEQPLPKDFSTVALGTNPAVSPTDAGLIIAPMTQPPVFLGLPEEFIAYDQESGDQGQDSTRVSTHDYLPEGFQLPSSTQSTNLSFNVAINPLPVSNELLNELPSKGLGNLPDQSEPVSLTTVQTAPATGELPEASDRDRSLPPFAGSAVTSVTTNDSPPISSAAAPSLLLISPKTSERKPIEDRSSHMPGRASERNEPSSLFLSRIDESKERLHAPIPPVPVSTTILEPSVKGDSIGEGTGAGGSIDDTKSPSLQHLEIVSTETAPLPQQTTVSAQSPSDQKNFLSTANPEQTPAAARTSEQQTSVISSSPQETRPVESGEEPHTTSPDQVRQLTNRPSPSTPRPPIVPVGFALDTNHFALATDLKGSLRASLDRSQQGDEPGALSGSEVQAVLGGTLAPHLSTLEQPANVSSSPVAHPREIVHQLVQAVGNKLDVHQSISVELKPEDLGRVRIEVSQKEGVMVASIEAERPSTAHAISDSISQLHDSLHAIGLTFERIEISTAEFSQPRGDWFDGTSLSGRGNSQTSSQQDHSGSRQPPEQQPRQLNLRRNEPRSQPALRSRNLIRDIDIRV